MSLGTLTAVVDAETRGFIQGMAAAAARMEAFAHQAKKLARDVAQVSGALVAFAAGALHMAATVDGSVKRNVEELKSSMLTLAVQISQMVMPAVQELSRTLRELADWFAGLSPQVRAQVGHWAVLAVEVAGAALVLGRVATIGGAVASVLQGIAVTVAAIGLGSMMGFIVILGSLAVALALVHKAWRTNWHGMRDVILEVVPQIGSAIMQFGQMLKIFVIKELDAMVDLIARISAAAGALVGSIQAGLGFGETLKNVGAAAVAPKSDLVNDSAAKVGKILEDSALDTKNEWAQLMVDLKAKIDEYFGNKGHAPPPRDSAGDESLRDYAERHHAALVKVVSEDPDPNADYRSSLQKFASEKHKATVEGAITGKNARELEEHFKAELEAREQFINAIGYGVQLFISKLGDLGQVIGSAVQGFQAGGPWGAIIAVFIELLSRFKRFQELIDIGNGQIQVAISELAGAFGDFIDGVKPLMGAIGMIAHVVHEILAPIISFIGKLLGSLAPVFALISVVLEPIGRSLATLFDVIGQTLGPAFEILEKVATGIALVFMGLQEPLLWLKAEFLELARWLDHTFNVTGNHSGVDKAVVDAWADLHANEQKMKDIADKGLGGLARDAADAAGAIGKLGNTADQVSRQLTNIPQGFNTFLKEWQASFATSSTAFGGGSGSGSDERDSFRQTGNATKSSGSSYHRGKNKADSSEN